MNQHTENIKTVKYLLPAVEVDMGGFPVKQPLPTAQVQQIDPFLLLHHAEVKFSSDRPAKSQGVGAHPHRGFSPVTFVIQGEVHHRDSRGNSTVAKTGEVQWMNAGAGIVHSERPSDHIVEEGEKQEIIQLWVNTPAKYKMDSPEYFHFPETEIPVITSKDGKVSNKLIAGAYSGKKGKVTPKSDLLVMWGSAKEGAEETLSIPENFNSSLYLIKGTANVKGYGIVEAENLLFFNQEGDTIALSFSSDAQFLLLAGKPLNEKVTQYGPFVMNTQSEIMNAMRDYQMGKMGVLIEED